MRWPVGTEKENAEALDRLPGRWEDINPYANKYQFGYHTGFDLVLHYPTANAGIDSPLYAIAPGVITFSGIGRGTTWGWIVIVQHRDADGTVWYTRTAHGDHTNYSVKRAGQSVAEGEELIPEGNADGYYGSGYHCHFDVCVTEALLKDPSDWPGLDLARLEKDYTDPFEWIVKRKKSEMVMLYNALLQSNSSLIPVFDGSGTLLRWIAASSPVVVDGDKANAIILNSLVYLPLKGGGYIYNKDAVIGTPYAAPAPGVVAKQITSDGLYVRADSNHTAAKTGILLKYPAVVNIVDDGGTTSTDAGHDYVFFKLADGSGYIAGTIDGVSYLQDPPPVSAGSVLYGFDSSHYNTWQANPDLSGIDFVILKGGQGNNIDESYEAHYGLSKAAGKEIITYLFPVAPDGQHTMIGQAKTLLAITKPGGIAVDYEENTDGTIPTIPQLVEFLAAILDLTGLTKLLVYTRTNLLPDNSPPELTKYDLFLPITSLLPKGWTADQLKFVQYDQGIVPGVGGPLDLDRFVGTQADLHTYIASITPNTPPAPTPSVGPGLWGINTDPHNPSANPSAAQLSGASWVRMVFQASSQKQTIPQAFAFYDQIIPAIRAAGTNILLVLNQETYADGWPVWSPQTTWQTYAKNFAATCAQVAAHYKGIVSAYEIWNEPDDPGAQSARMDAANFGLLMRAVTPSIRAVDPLAKVGAGGLSGGDPVGYLKAAGDLGAPDAVGRHPYTKSAAQIVDDTKALHAAFGLPVWHTEFGEPDAGNVGLWTGIALDMAMAYSAVAALGSDVCAMLCWFAWSDAQNSDKFGIVDVAGKPKGAIYNQFVALCKLDANSPATPPVSPTPTTTPPPVVVVPPAPAPVTPTGYVSAVGKCRPGVSIYDPQDVQQVRQQILDIALRLKVAGKPFGACLVMDDPDMANKLADLCNVVLYREYAYDSKWDGSRMVDTTSALKYADELYTGWGSKLAQLDKRVVIQPVNEKDNAQWSNTFFLQFMARADADGRKVALFGDSPENPSVAAMQTRIPAMRYAMAHGHIYCLHDYGPFTSTGQVTSLPVSTAANFDKAGGYHRTLYASLPADCRPNIVSGETAPSDAIYTGVEHLVSDMSAYNVELQSDPVWGFAWWLFGRSFQNRAYEANAALDAIEVLMMSI